MICFTDLCNFQNVFYELIIKRQFWILGEILDFEHFDSGGHYNCRTMVAETECIFTL